MSAVRFLCDEHVDHSLAEAIGNREPGVEMLFVGDAGTPAFGSTDPALLQWVEQRKYALVSADRRTIPAHISEHLALGRHTWGVFLIRRGATWSKLIEDLLLIWSSSEDNDWQDQLEYLPW